jgi:hypothetical protein
MIIDFFFLQLLTLLFVGLSVAFPAADNNQPFLSIKITRPDGGFDSSVSKSEVNLLEKGPNGEIASNEPFHPHVPPFLAFRKDYQAAPLAYPNGR